MSEHEDNFEPLRRLLALKRHEVPPPGYFNNFSSHVLQQIRAGHNKQSAGVMEDLAAQLPWLSKWLQLFGQKPVFASGFAGALCMLLLFGIVSTERPDLASQPLLGSITTPLAPMSSTALPQSAESIGIVSVSSTNPVLSLQPVTATLAFGQQNPLAQPVSFQFPR